MNWVGGALARLKARQEQNRDRFPTSRIRRDHEPPTEDDENDMLEVEEDEEGQTQQQRSRRTSRKKRREEPVAEWKQELDYAALGYKLVVPRAVQRRVVPLLEFIEKEFPHGHVVSLQLSHQMDITTAPILSSESQRSRNFPDNDPDIGDDITSQTSKDTITSVRLTADSSSRVESVIRTPYSQQEQPNLPQTSQTSASTTTNETSTV